MDKVTTAQIHPEIACSKLLRTDKQTTAKNAVVFCRRALTPLARFDLGLVLCRNKYKRAMTARFRNVAKGNISRLRDAQAFHRRAQLARLSQLPACAVYFWAWLRHNNKENK